MKKLMMTLTLMSSVVAFGNVDMKSEPVRITFDENTKTLDQVCPEIAEKAEQTAGRIEAITDNKMSLAVRKVLAKSIDTSFNPIPHEGENTYEKICARVADATEKAQNAADSILERHSFIDNYEYRLKDLRHN